MRACSTKSLAKVLILSDLSFFEYCQKALSLFVVVFIMKPSKIPCPEAHPASFHEQHHGRPESFFSMRWL